MLRLSIIAIFFSRFSFAGCLPPSTNETGCHINASQFRAFKEYIGCRQDNYHEYCLNLVLHPIAPPRIGYLGSSTDRDAYARKFAEKIAKSRELTGIVIDAILAAATVPPGASAAAKADQEKVLEVIKKSRNSQLRAAVESQEHALGTRHLTDANGLTIRNKLIDEAMRNHRSMLEPFLKIELNIENGGTDISHLTGNPKGYVTTIDDVEFSRLKEAGPIKVIDPPDEIIKPDYSAAAKMKERIAERESGLQFEGEHPDLKAMREAKEARALREIPQMTKKEVEATTTAMARRLSTAGIIGPVVGAVATPLVELIALAYEDRNAKRLDCAGLYPFVPTKGMTGNGAGNFTCQPTPFPDLSKKERFLHREYPREVGMFLSLPEAQQLKLMNVKAGKYFGICDYYSRAFSDVFAGTKYCTGRADKAPGAATVEGKTN